MPRRPRKRHSLTVVPSTYDRAGVGSAVEMAMRRIEFLEVFVNSRKDEDDENTYDLLF